MSATRDQLIAIRQDYLDTLQAIAIGPAKLTYSVEGRNFTWTEYQKFLNQQIQSLKLLIDDEDNPIVEEITTYYQ